MKKRKWKGMHVNENSADVHKKSGVSEKIAARIRRENVAARQVYCACVAYLLRP